VAAVERDGCGLLRHCVGGIAGALWRPGDIDAQERRLRPNTDLGSQFTCFALAGGRLRLTAALNDAEIRITMYVCDRLMDNVFIERLWRSMKSEYVYFHAC
jgi:hypothetical protein